jgi:hypothetical protein
MSRWNRKQLVLDASIATGSSDQMYNPTGDIAGDRNRDCLQAVWEEEHIAVFNNELRVEWREHASPSAIAWLQRMAQKSRIIVEEGNTFSELLGPACACQSTEGEKTAIEKDFHLIRSALATGQLIVSNETRFPRYVAGACVSVPKLLELHYGNPVLEGEVCRLWIKAGAEKEANRRIDQWVVNHCANA